MVLSGNWFVPQLISVALLLAACPARARPEATDISELTLEAPRAPPTDDSRIATRSWVGADDIVSIANGTASAVPSASDLTWPIWTAVCVIALVVLAVVGNAVYAKFVEDEQGWFDFLWPSMVTASLGLLNWLLWLTVLARGGGDSDDNIVTYLMFGCLVWLVITFCYERAKGLSNYKDKEVVIMEDFYCDLTKPIFVVLVRFLLQALLMVLLILVAEERVKAGLPDGLSVFQTLVNLGLALILQLYLFHAMKAGGTWEELLRLRDARVVEVTDVDGVPLDERIFKVPQGEWYVRMAMSVMNQGVFAKFLIVAYPLYIFPTSSMIDLVKDAFAITFVNEIGDMGSPSTFMVRIESAAEAWTQAKAAAAEAAAALGKEASEAVEMIDEAEGAAAGKEREAIELASRS